MAGGVTCSFARRRGLDLTHQKNQQMAGLMPPAVVVEIPPCWDGSELDLVPDFLGEEGHELLHAIPLICGNGDHLDPLEAVFEPGQVFL